MFTKENLKNVTFVAQEGVEIEKGLRIKRFVTGKRMLGFVVPTYDVIGKAQFINWRSVIVEYTSLILKLFFLPFSEK